MRIDKKYLTQVSASDLKEIARAANAEGGEGIEIRAKESVNEIRIDKDQLRIWLWNFYQNGGFTATNPLSVSLDQVQ